VAALRVEKENHPMILMLAFLLSLPAPTLKNVPFACNLRAFTAAERVSHARTGRRLWDAVIERREVEHGYAFRLPAGELITAAEWIRLERRCCPFFDFELRQGRDGGALWLHVLGGDGIKTFIRAEFGFDDAP
jgi:hypothetical protein